MKDDLSFTPHGPFPHTEGFSSLGAVRAAYANNVVDENILGSDGTTPDIADRPAFVGLALSEKRIAVAFIALGLMLLLIIARAAYVQIVRGADYAKQSESNRSRIISVPVERGVIYDRNGVPLVQNIPDFSAAVTPDDLPKDPAARLDVIGRLATLLNIQPTDIEQRLDEFRDFSSSPVTVADDLTHDQAVLIDIESARTPAVSLITDTRRDYLQTTETQSLSHVLGYEGRLTKDELVADKGASSYQPTDFIGKAGVEKSYEATLRGTNGTRRIEVDATGNEKTVISEDPGQPGKNLVLTIDVNLQRDVEKLFLAGLKAAGNKTRGSVIVMNPANGDILALVSEPAFDSNDFAKGISAAEYQALAGNPDHPLFSRAISGSLASGSVFKPVIGTAAMQEHVITANTTVDSTGGIRVGQWFFPDWKVGGSGITDLQKAIADSVNSFFYEVGGGYGDFKGLGVDRIVAWAKKFGFGAKLGIDLPSEGAGFLPSKAWKLQTTGQPWYIGDTYHLSIGQGDLLVTPLQIANMTAVVANHGVMMQPRVVQAYTTTDGTRVTKPPVVLNPHVADLFAIDEVRKGMRMTITDGVARSLNTLPIEVAGKTGTAQWNSNKANQAWFTSFAPYDKPQIVVTVMIEEGGEGSSTAAPIAKAIYQRYFQNLMPSAKGLESIVPPATPAPAAAVPMQPGEDPIGTAQP
jgi:penicillin-binding protein 2